MCWEKCCTWEEGGNRTWQNTCWGTSWTFTHQTSLGCSNKEVWDGRDMWHKWGKWKAYVDFVGNPERRRPLPRSRSRWEYLLTCLLTYSMEQSPSWEANRFSAGQEILHILWNLKVHYRIHKCQLSLSWASSIQSIPPHPTSWRSVLILSSHLCLGLLSGIFTLHFSLRNSCMNSHC